MNKLTLILSTSLLLGLSPLEKQSDLTLSKTDQVVQGKGEERKIVEKTTNYRWLKREECCETPYACFTPYYWNAIPITIPSHGEMVRIITKIENKTTFKYLYDYNCDDKVDEIYFALKVKGYKRFDKKERKRFESADIDFNSVRRYLKKHYNYKTPYRHKPY